MVAARTRLNRCIKFQSYLDQTLNYWLKVFHGGEHERVDAHRAWLFPLRFPQLLEALMVWCCCTELLLDKEVSVGSGHD